MEIKFITPTAAFVEASPGRPLYFCPIGELSTSNVTNVHDYFRAGQKIDGIVRLLSGFPTPLITHDLTNSPLPYTSHSLRIVNIRCCPKLKMLSKSS